MKSRNIQGDTVTYQTLLKGCLKFRKYPSAAKVLEDAIKNGVFISKDILESIFNGLLDSGNQENKLKVDKLKEQLKKAKPNKAQGRNNYQNKGKFQHNKNYSKSMFYIVRNLHLFLDNSYKNKKWVQGKENDKNHRNVASSHTDAVKPNSENWDKNQWNRTQWSKQGKYRNKEVQGSWKQGKLPGKIQCFSSFNHHVLCLWGYKC